MPRDVQPSQSERQFEVGDQVRYQHWTGRIYKILPSTVIETDWLYIDFTLNPDPIPFFRGPYKPEEVERVD